MNQLGDVSRRACGRLVIVVCSDAGRLDLVLSAARRHLAASFALSFVEPIGTRRLPAGSGVVVTRGGLRDLERMSGVCLAWQSGAQRYGLSVSVLARLAEGETVVVGADADISSAARAIWPEVSVVRLMVATDGMRKGLSPRACFTRIVGPRSARRGPIRNRDEVLAGSVRDDGDLATEVRSLAQILSSLAPNRTNDTDPPGRVSFAEPPAAASVKRRQRLNKAAAPANHNHGRATHQVRPREPL